MVGCRMPGFPRNARGMDYAQNVQKHGVIAGAVSEDFNVAAVCPHCGATDS